MAHELFGAAILLVLVLVGLLSALGATAVAFGHDSARDDARGGLSPWR
jgi:hypothetical protein